MADYPDKSGQAVHSGGFAPALATLICNSLCRCANANAPAKLLFGQADSLKHCTCEEDTMKLLNFLNDNTKYTQEAIDQNIEGTVILSLCILETGEVSDITVFRGSYKILNDEAI